MQDFLMLNEALRLIRVYHDLKQKDAAKRLEISSSYLSEVENGHKAPTLELINRYSETFNIPVSAIMFFAEHVEGDGAPDRAREFVAGKMIGLLQFLEARSSNEPAE
jgi:transcriptional regulator with XRE-family HTH domain